MECFICPGKYDNTIEHNCLGNLMDSLLFQCVTEDVEDGHAAVIDYTLFHETISDFPTPTSSFAENSHPFQGGDDL